MTAMDGRHVELRLDLDPFLSSSLMNRLILKGFWPVLDFQLLGGIVLPIMHLSIVYKSGTGTRGQGHGTCVWGLGTSGHREHQVWDAGTSKTGTQGTRDVNEYRKSRR